MASLARRGVTGVQTQPRSLALSLRGVSCLAVAVRPKKAGCNVLFLAGSSSPPRPAGQERKLFAFAPVAPLPAAAVTKSQPPMQRFVAIFQPLASRLDWPPSKVQDV